MVDVVFQTLVACQNNLDKQHRPRSILFFWSRLIRVYPVCCSNKHAVNSSPDNIRFSWEQKEKKVKKAYFQHYSYWPSISVQIE